MSTTLNTEEVEAIVSAIEESDIGFGQDLDQILDYDYSGRGMYGRSCIGLRVDSMKQAVQVLVAVAEHDADLARLLAEEFTTDSLGMGIIAYFPGVQVADVPEMAG